MAKRTFDIVVSALGLVLLSPVFLAVALAIKVDSPGPIFYLANRVGRFGTPFTLLKFRSMTVSAERQGPGITTKGDPRITSIGKFLRRTKLDEMPQLINVLIGDMSLVGPRPEDPRYVALYTPEQQIVLMVRPGITSRASLYYRHEENMLDGPEWESQYIHQVMPAKLAIDEEYIKKRSIAEDSKIILQTLACMFERADRKD